MHQRKYGADAWSQGLEQAIAFGATACVWIKTGALGAHQCRAMAAPNSWLVRNRARSADRHAACSRWLPGMAAGHERRQAGQIHDAITTGVHGGDSTKELMNHPRE